MLATSRYGIPRAKEYEEGMDLNACLDLAIIYSVPSRVSLGKAPPSKID